MTEIVFVVEEAEEGGYNAYAVGQSIYTQAADLTELRLMVRDAINCHYDEDDAERPRIIRLHFVRDEVLPLSAA
ncbi:MAG: 2-oxoisovalerate dehydrogenase [bacterium]|nr:2-oxoisovalerate dehydrogenase [bacterium]